jgi:hypothetical protein
VKRRAWKFPVLNVSFMLSTLQKTFSDALSSFTSTKEPTLLNRPSSDIPTPPNDTAISPTAAHMPPLRSSTSSKTDTKRHKGGKATEFLRRHFDAAGDQDDPIEVRLSQLNGSKKSVVRLD